MTILDRASEIARAATKRHSCNEAIAALSKRLALQEEILLHPSYEKLESLADAYVRGCAGPGACVLSFNGIRAMLMELARANAIPDSDPDA